MRVFSVLTMLGAGLAFAAAPAAADPWSTPQQIATGGPGSGYLTQLVESSSGHAFALLATDPYTAVERQSTGAAFGVQGLYGPAELSGVAMAPTGELAAGSWTLGSCEARVDVRSPAGAWEPTTTFAQACAVPGAFAQPPVVAIGRSGALLAAWREEDPGIASKTLVSERTPAGVWSDPVVVDGAVPFAAVIDQKGRGLVELLSEGGVTRHVELAFINAGKVHRLQLLPEGTDIGSIASNAKGKVVLAVNRWDSGQPAFVDVYTGTARRMKLASTFGGPGTNAQVGRDAAGLDGAGDAIVAWSQLGLTRKNSSVVVTRRVGKGAFGEPLEVEPPRQVQQVYGSVYLDPRGAATVAWLDISGKTQTSTLEAASAPLGGAFGPPTPLAVNGDNYGIAALLAGDAAGNVTAAWSIPNGQVFDTFASQRPPVSG